MEQDEFVSYYKSPVGWLELVAGPDGIREVSFTAAPPAKKGAASHPTLKLLADELDLYFAGTLTAFSVPLAPKFGTEFQRKVWDRLLAIPYGETRSYADIATEVGDRKAARAVGSANGSNPLPILVPCHRVIKGDGSLGGYGSGIDVKRKLLELEGIRI